MNPSGQDASTSQHFFLSTLTKGLTSDQHFLVAKRVAWNDKVTDEPREAFPAEEWREQYLDGPWYFSTGASNDRKSRKRENMVALCAIVLDDVGTKVQPEAILAAPTWVIETSTGNYQWGFLLKEWTTDIQAGDDLFAGLISAGLQDPGVKTCCRLFRIPGSVNDKPGRDGFVSVLHDFEPGRVYTLQSLAKALKVKPGKAPTARVDSGVRPNAGKPDPTFQWLHEKGYVRNEASGGYWEIVCPFKEEHSDGRVTMKYLPLSQSECGYVKVECHHGHGGISKEEFTQRFMDWLHEQGAPIPEQPAGVRRMDPAFSKLLGQWKQASKPKPQVRKQQPPEPVEHYTFGSLRKLLPTIPKSELPQVERTKDEGTAKIQPCTFSNVEFGLKHMGVQVRLNLMTARTSYILPEHIDMAGFGNKRPRDIDNMIEAVLLDCFNTAGMRNKPDVLDAMTRIASSLFWHPAKDWIESAAWDGQDRFEPLAATVTTDTPGLFRMYLRRWLLQTVECACGWAVRSDPTQKALCLVLAGPQYKGKTAWFKSLAPSGFVKTGKHLNLNGNTARDSKHEAMQALMVELGELDTTFSKSDVGALKAFISTDTDEYRLPFERVWLERPRTTSFCGTVNDPEFLRDATGSRRFGVIKAERCDFEHGIDMQQVFAQVKTWWDAGEQWWLTEHEAELQSDNNERFNTVDAVEERIVDEIAAREDRDDYALECALSQTQVAELFGIDVQRSRDAMVRVGQALRKVLGEAADYRMRVADGSRGCTKRGWVFWLTDAEAARVKVKPLRTRQA